MNYTVRKIQSEEVEEALALALEVFMQFEAPAYKPEGTETFKRDIIQNKEFAEKCRKGVLPIYAAFDKGKIIGIVGLGAMRHDRIHINLVFTKREYHRCGVASGIFKFLLEDILKENPLLKRITLNSSPYGLPFYLHLGFLPLSEETEKNGIRYTPMEYRIMKEELRTCSHMKITIIHGQSHKGSTYHLARSLAEKIGGGITEIFLPKDFNEFCVGCTRCFTDSETKCPHYEKLSPITGAIDEADVIILASPVYVYHASGAMKALLDHYGWRWMVHRPEEKMFSKQAVCISTAAGAGMKSTNRDMADSLFWWGAGKIYKFGAAVSETAWERVNDKKKQTYDKRLTSLAAAIGKRQGRVKPSAKTKAFFSVMRIMQKNGFNKADMDYWNEMGWTGKKRPWN